MTLPATPPEGSPWDSPVAETPLAFVDLEMTGLDVATDRVVEICVERWRGEVCEDRVESLVHPGDRAGGNAHVHGLDAAALAEAPPFAALAPRVRALFDGAILVAHAATWDIRFLEMEMQRAEQPFTVPFWLDTLVLARRAFAFHSYALGALCTSLSIERGLAHRAGSDVAAMRELFRRCLANLTPSTPRDLWEVRIAERHARPAIVAACEAAVEHATSVLLTYRPSKKPPQAMLMILTEVQASLDPPRVIGYQLPGRGRRELRADRILSVVPPSSAESSERKS